MWDFLVCCYPGGPVTKRNRYTEEKIISILKEHEAGVSVPELSRRHAVAENTIYRWKSKYGGMEVSEVKRLRELEQENARLKKLLAEAELRQLRCSENHSRRGLWLSPKKLYPRKPQ
jgi:putative transposase